jgi:hypothetical protein
MEEVFSTSVIEVLLQSFPLAMGGVESNRRPFPIAMPFSHDVPPVCSNAHTHEPRVAGADGADLPSCYPLTLSFPFHTPATKAPLKGRARRKDKGNRRGKWPGIYLRTGKDKHGNPVGYDEWATKDVYFHRESLHEG